RPPGFTPFRIA
nr:RecName: Full=[Thr6]-bradykinin RA-11; Contains: RecName: Full=[Thr6]-bradykinin [Pelophylax ridibundus]